MDIRLTGSVQVQVKREAFSIPASAFELAEANTRNLGDGYRQREHLYLSQIEHKGQELTVGFQTVVAEGAITLHPLFIEGDGKITSEDIEAELISNDDDYDD